MPTCGKPRRRRDSRGQLPVACRRLSNWSEGSRIRRMECPECRQAFAGCKRAAAPEGSPKNLCAIKPAYERYDDFASRDTLRLVASGGFVSVINPISDRCMPLMVVSHAEEDEEGDRFDAFVREQYPRLTQFLRARTPSPQEAEDGAQESVVKLLRYRHAAPPEDWTLLLYRIAINHVRDQFRAARRRRALAGVATLEGEAVSTDRSPDEYADRAQVLARIRRVLRELPPRCQRICVLKLAGDATNTAIARYCGISTKMVEKHLAKGFATIRREVVSVSAATTGGSGGHGSSGE